MKRNAFLMTAVLFSLSTAALAANQKQDGAQSQPQQAEPKQMARYEAGEYGEYASPTKNKHKAKAEKKSQPEQQQEKPEGDPRDSQNQVEYGGAG